MRKRGPRNSRTGDDGAMLLGGASEGDEGAPRDSGEVAPLGGLAGETYNDADDDERAPGVPTVTKEQWERDNLAAAPAGASPTGVAKPVPIEQYNSRVARARLANSARLRAATTTGTAPVTPPLVSASPPAAAPPMQPLAALSEQPAAPAAPAPANLID